MTGLSEKNAKIKSTERGGYVAEVSIKKLREYLMANIDTSDLVEVDKVNRYCTLTSMMRKLKTEANKDGVVVVTENASQKFTKTHPAIEKMTTINTQLLNIEKSFHYIMPDNPLPDDNTLNDEELV